MTLQRNPIGHSTEDSPIYPPISRGRIPARRIAIFIMSAVMCLGLGVTEARGDTCRIPATGQEVSFTGTTETFTGAPVLDDGALRVGAPLSYRDNGDGTVSDLNTGLTWEKKSLDGSIHDVDLTFAWSSPSNPTIWDWLAQVNTEGGTGFAGYTDWRIPNEKELLSIAHFGTVEPAIDAAFNNNISPGCTVLTCSATHQGGGPGPYYASSTTSASDPSAAWVQDYAFGSSGPEGKAGGFWGAFFVRAVRSGCPQFPATGQTTSYSGSTSTATGAPVRDDGTVRAGAPLSYRDNGDGTITDLNSGLMWEKKSRDEGLHDAAGVYLWSSSTGLTIWDWLKQVNAEGGVGFAGHSDWRIPNVKEFVTILDYEVSQPAVAGAFSTGDVPGCTVLTCSATSYGSVIGGYPFLVLPMYASSTREAGGFGAPWGVDFAFGKIRVAGLADAWFVRAVRGGISVPFTFTGFFAPVDNPPVLNLGKAGQTIPVKWTLAQGGTPVSDPASFKSLTSYPVMCSDLTGNPTDALPVNTAGSSGLQYLGNGTWQYNWKTLTSYANTCRRAVLTLQDGDTHTFDLKFTK